MSSRKRKRSTSPTGEALRGRAGVPTCRYDGFSPINSTESSISSMASSPDSDGLDLPAGRLRYPPYLLIPYIRDSSRFELVKGSTCKVIMGLLSDGHPFQHIVMQLGSLFRQSPHDFGERPYDFDEVKAIVKTCREIGLDESNALEADYEGESIDRWWMESACTEEERREPVGREAWEMGRGLAESEGWEGWWTKRESRDNRNWERWGNPEIGPRAGFRTDDGFGRLTSQSDFARVSRPG